MFDRFKKLLNPSPEPTADPALDRLEAALSPIRESYQRSLQGHFEELQQKNPGLEVCVELMVALPSTSQYFPRNHYRIDTVVPGPVDPKEGSKVVEVQTPPHLPSVTSLELGGLSMTLQPFSWGICRLLLSGEAKPGFAAEILQWYEYWIDVDDDRTGHLQGFQGVIHSVSLDGPENGSWNLQADFGSAPTAAFLELVQLLARQFEGQILVDEAVGETSDAPAN